MILNRISRALQEQNWFVVILELLIVVLGIFLGLQVNEWNEERKFHNDEVIYLEKIQDDLLRMKQDIAEKYEGYEDRINFMIRALDALETCDASAEAIEALERSMGAYQAGRPVDYISATYDEMVSSGALARIDNQPLKSGIAQTFSLLSTLGSVMLSYRISIPVVDAIIWRNVAYSIDRETLRHAATVDVEAICNKQEVRNAVVEMIDIQKDGQGAMDRAAQSVDELLQLLEEHRNES